MSTNPMQFLRETRAEVRKVTFPDWKSTRMMTLMVLMLVILVSLFLVAVDLVSQFFVNSLLGI